MSWHFWLSDKTVRKFQELPIHCQRQNSSLGILVSSKVKWILAGVCWKGASNESGVVVNDDFRFFRSLYLSNHHIQGHKNYILLCSPLMALTWRRIRWPWMILNVHFAIIPSALAGKWPNRHQTCTRRSPGKPASRVCSKSRSAFHQRGTVALAGW